VIECRKLYTDIPFAHRQHRHDGHCAYIHGHNWSIAVTFGCHHTDENGFVVDFGKLRFLRHWIEENLDHACVLNRDDPERAQITGALGPLIKLYVVDDCSCEGLARHLFDVFDGLVRAHTHDRAFVTAIEVMEDARNSATWRP